MASTGMATDGRRQRGQATRERILDAARAIVREGGFEPLDLNELQRRVSVSRGGIYRHFASIDAVAAAVRDELVLVLNADEKSAFAEVPDDASPRETADAAVCALSWLVRRHAGLLLHTQRLGLATDASAEVIFLRFRRAFDAVLDRIRHDDPERALGFAFRAALTTVLSSVEFEERIPAPLRRSQAELDVELGRMVAAYLFETGSR